MEKGAELKPDAVSPESIFPNERESSDKRHWDDKEIFIRNAFQDDPRKGCELLFRHYYSSLCNHAVRFVYARNVAQDIVGEVFLVFWQKQLHTKITSSFRAYLFIAVRNRSIKYIQREFGKTASAHDLVSFDDSVGSSSPTPHQILQHDELSLRIERAIQSLSPQCQKVFLMNRFDGMKYQQIAAELNISLKTVEAHMSKALDVMRKLIREAAIIFLLLSV